MDATTVHAFTTFKQFLSLDDAADGTHRELLAIEGFFVDVAAGEHVEDLRQQGPIEDQCLVVLGGSDRSRRGGYEQDQRKRGTETRRTGPSVHGHRRE